MKQTAVEWLVEQLKEYDFSTEDDTYIIKIPSWVLTEKEEQAKAMEKQQIIDAVYHNCSSMTHYDLPCGEQYYNETYKSE